MLFSSFCKNIQIAKQMPKETRLHSGCKHASNPYHVCSEYCFDFVADPKKLVAIKDPASVEGEKTGVNRDCRHSSNPYHVCSEYCFEVVSEPKKSAPKTESASVEGEKTGVQRGCRHSSNPYHVCSEFCSDVISEPKKSATKNDPASVQAEKTGVNRDCRHSSNPYHICSEFCSDVISETKKSAAKTEPAGLKAETRNSQPASVKGEKTGVNRDCRYSSNPYHVCSEFCFEEPKKSTAKNEPGETRSSQPTSISSFEAEEKGVNRNCRYSSNPYHVCSEFCFEATSEPKKSTAKNEPAEGLKAETRSSQPTSISVEAEKTGVNRDCRHSSNPYHVCSEYCFEEPKKSTAKNEPVGLKAETGSSQSSSISTASSVEGEKTGVNRGCRYSSNPYHVCSEFCFQVIAEPKKSKAKNEVGRRHFRKGRKSVDNGRLISV